MLLDFSERIQGKKSPSNVLDHEMLEMATTRSMCELHPEMIDYETTSDILPSWLPTFLSFGVLMILRTWGKQRKAKRRSARVKRRLLLDELEERILEFQNLSLSNEHGHYVNGLVLYTLDRLYKAAERLAKADGEWRWLVAYLISHSFFNRTPVVITSFVCLIIN
ncbi:protein DGS1, mitochondrial, partial [Tanacetum coccineum]